MVLENIWTEKKFVEESLTNYITIQGSQQDIMNLNIRVLDKKDMFFLYLSISTTQFFISL